MELIDADWIRVRLTGRHGELKELADAAQVTPDKITKILKGERQIKAIEAQRIATYFRRGEAGFAEPPSEFRHQVSAVNPTGRVMAISAALCPDLRHPEAYRVRQPVPGAGLLVNDLLIVELGMTAAAGDLVVVTISDTDHDTHATLIRKFWPPLVVPVSAEDPYPALSAETAGQELAIVASVKALARGGALH